MAIPFVPYVFTDAVANDVTAARLNAIAQAARDAQLLPAVRVFHNAAQATTSGTALALAFNSERIDQASGVADTMHDTVTNNSRLTCRYAGVYQITANIEWANGTTASRTLSIRLNGATTIGHRFETPNTGIAVTQFVTTLYPLAVNDYVEAMALQNSGGALNVNAAGNYSPEFMMVRVA